METKKTLVSVIVPVYNAEKYIARCVDSILAQTYQNFELILVDDGSPDNSGSICDEYAAKDSRIVVIHKENGGVSSARNAGIVCAQGEYIVFVDSDDWVEKDHILNMLPEGNEDLVCCGIKFIKNDVVIDESVNVPTVVCSDNWKQNFLTFWKQYGILSPWRSLYKLETVKKHDLFFDSDLSIGEDELFNLNYLKHCSLVRYTDKTTYCYDVSDSPSLMKRFHEDRLESSKKASRVIEDITKKDEYGTRWYYWHWVISHFEKWISDKINRRRVKSGLKQCYNDPYFRECIPYIRTNGTLDEKIETYFMKSWLHPLYKLFYSIISGISKLKNKLLHKG